MPILLTQRGGTYSAPLFYDALEKAVIATVEENRREILIIDEEREG